MIFDFIKRFLPRGLYGRAALILILPIVTIQLVVSITFIQRHYEDVTRQMTRNVVLEVALLAERVGEASDIASAQKVAADLGQSLAMTVVLPAENTDVTAAPPARFDFSGRVIVATLHSYLSDLVAVELSNARRVHMILKTPHGLMDMNFDRRRVSATNPHQLLVLMVVTGVLMTLIAVLFLRNQLRPIRRLSRAAEAFGKGRVVPYKPAGAIEVRAAGNAFLDMRARIERQIEQRMLLLSGVSHDLRTPLTRLKLGLSLLGDDTELQALGRDIDEMQRLLDAFLAYVRDEAVDEVPQMVDPWPFVQSIVEDSQRAGHNVSLNGVPEQGPTMLRAGAIRRAVDNLINNASRYGSRINVSLNVLSRSLRIVVEDNGPGIAEERREEALQPFTRLDPSRNQDQGSGVGLGLAITADIARQHGGTLRLGVSESLGGLKAELILAR
jgi:two-component system osmolarity sensor histidine kinase EnvZ